MKKYLSKITICIVLIAISIYTTFYLDLILQKKEDIYFTIDFIAKCKSIFTSQRTITLFGCLSLTFVCLIFYFFRNKKNNNQTETMKITDNIEIPVPKGQRSTWYSKDFKRE